MPGKKKTGDVSKAAEPNPKELLDRLITGRSLKVSRDDPPALEKAIIERA